MQDIRHAIYDVVMEGQPMTVRQTVYQLVVQGVVAKTEQEYNQTVGHLLREMRVDGTICYHWIVDELRWCHITTTLNSPGDALDHLASYYRRGVLNAGNEAVQVWCQKVALIGIIEPICDHYDVPLEPSSGYASYSQL